MREPVSLPERYELRIEAALLSLGYSLGKPGRLADAILRLSDHYLDCPSARSPLSEPWAQAAYLAYYFPLNYARATAVVREADRLGFFEGLERMVDFGSGLGSAAFATLEAAPRMRAVLAIDASREALRLQTLLASDDWPDLRFDREAKADGAPPLGFSHDSLAIFSYSLTEMDELPAWAADQEALFVLEPSSQEDGRRLQTLRSELIEAGFSAWAPCTHQNACPLLAQSERDWCHARVVFQPPTWWGPIETLLPIKNRTLAFSYLLARRTRPRVALGTARAIGDVRPEKGKTRTAICRGPDREFLTWFPQRMKDEPDLARGDLFRLPTELETRGAEGAREIRLASSDQLEVIASSRPRKSTAGPSSPR